MILIDTVVLLRIAEGVPVSKAALDAISNAAQKQKLFLSAISLWELDTLARKAGRSKLFFKGDCKQWLGEALKRIPATIIAFEAEDAIAMLDLPPEMHGDPADRMLVSTARRRAIPFVTSDRKIIDLARLGVVDVIQC